MAGKGEDPPEVVYAGDGGFRHDQHKRGAAEEAITGQPMPGGLSTMMSGRFSSAAMRRASGGRR